MSKEEGDLEVELDLELKRRGRVAFETQKRPKTSSQNYEEEMEAREYINERAATVLGGNGEAVQKQERVRSWLAHLRLKTSANGDCEADKTNAANVCNVFSSSSPFFLSFVLSFFFFSFLVVCP